MHLTPREQEKLLIVTAADLARRRQKRGLKLNYPSRWRLSLTKLSRGAGWAQRGGPDELRYDRSQA